MDYQVGDEITTYRPQPIEWKPGMRMKPFADRLQEQEYETWRENMIFSIYGPQGE